MRTSPRVAFAVASACVVLLLAAVVLWLGLPSAEQPAAPVTVPSGPIPVAVPVAPPVPPTAPASAPTLEPEREEGLLTGDQQVILLALARQAVAARLAGEELPDVPGEEGVLGAALGCFVTLNKAGRLRGCIGNILPGPPLAEAVRNNALSAAFRDPRFRPLQSDELAEVKVEISVLTQPRELLFTGPDDLLAKLRPGVDGVVLIQGQRSATYLPQVWEQIAAAADFLSHLSRKAGLAADAWRDADTTRILTYQAFVFGEEHGDD